MKLEEVIKWLKAWSATHQNENDNIREAVWSAIGFIRELEQYKALGTVEKLKNALEKQVAKKPIRKEMPYSEEVGFNDEWHCPTCGAYVGYFTEGMSEPEQMEYCNVCGQHIAKDWSDK